MRRTPIIIDPGHGGTCDVGSSTAYGTRSGGLAEGDVAFLLAQRVQQHLGGGAMLTRDADHNPSLAERAALAQRYGAHTFVSIHAGSDSMPGTHGSEVWLHPQRSAGSERLAFAIGDELARVGAYRGVFEGPMALLSPTAAGSIRSCLVEADNLADPRGLSRLQDPSQLHWIGSAIATGIRRQLAQGYGQGFSRDWSGESEATRVRHVMGLLINSYGYSESAAAGIVGNLLAESGVIPNRVEGSAAGTPQRSQGFDGVTHDWTAEEIMNRDAAAHRGPRRPGVGLAQWTSRDRRRGLFAHEWEGVVLGAEILFSIDAQVHYLVHELTTDYHAVNAVLTRAGVSLEDASDEVVYRFEVPGAVLDHGRLRPRTDPEVVRVFEARRGLSRRALRHFRPEVEARPHAVTAYV